MNKINYGIRTKKRFIEHAYPIGRFRTGHPSATGQTFNTLVPRNEVITRD